MKSVRVVGIIYNPRATKALSMAEEIFQTIGPGRQCWMGSADDEITNPHLDETDLIITVGGDGTILRAVRVAVAHDIPLLGVNLGRLGFMTELRAEEALERIPRYLEGGGWLEERSMLQVQVLHGGGDPDPTDSPSFHALNDAVLGRGAGARLIWVKAFVDGASLTSYRADAVIVSSATGSTGYNLSAGGPILDPHAQEMILKPVAPHVGLATAVVLSASATVELTVESDDGAILSVDGYLDQRIQKADGVRIQRSPKKARFVREGGTRSSMPASPDGWASREAWARVAPFSTSVVVHDHFTRGTNGREPPGI